MERLDETLGELLQFDPERLTRDQVDAMLSSSALDELVVTDTIPLREDARACPRIRQLSVAELLAETMLRISNEESVSSLFME